MASRTWWWLVLAACGDPGHTPADAAYADASVCIPLDVCDWLDTYQRHVVEALAGGKDIAPGVTLAHRRSEEERELTRQFLQDELAALGYTPELHGYASEPYTGANVLAHLPATAGSGGTIIVGAHFDSVAAGPGAADNATGVALVLAAARYVRDVSVRQHPVTFVFFDQEELGLVGSRAYANSLVPTSIAAMHNFDMLSYDGDGDRAVELWSPAPELLAVYEHYGALAGMPIQPVMFGLSDHRSFGDRGIPSVGVSEEFVGMDHTPHYHQATDTLENVSFAHLAAVTHLALAVLAASVGEP